MQSKAVFAHLDIHGEDDAAPVWTARPNRRVAPNRWTLTSPGRPSSTFSQRIGLKLANPWTRHLLTLEREGESEPLHVVDATANGFGRAVGLDGGDWVLVRADERVAHLAWVARPRDEEADARSVARRGLLGAVARGAARLGASDRCLVSAAATHALSAPESLVLLLLVKELTDTSG